GDSAAPSIHPAFQNKIAATAVAASAWRPVRFRSLKARTFAMSQYHCPVHQPTLISLTTVVALLVSSGLAQSHDPYTDARLKMVDDDLVREGIKNELVLRAMRSVPRHLFCPPEWRAAAYYDQALPIGHKQTISSPFIVAYMTETLDPQ